MNLGESSALTPLLPASGRSPVKLLLIEDDEDDAFLIKEILNQADSVRTDRGHFKLVHVTTLQKALAALDHESFDIILLDLVLPDSRGLDSIRQLRVRSARTPVVILSGYDDEKTALEAVRHGAQDYLVKGQFDFKWLSHIMVYAIERKKSDVDVKDRELEGRRSTQRLLAQQTELLKSFLDSIGDGVLVADASGRWVRANPAAERLLGGKLVGLTADMQAQEFECLMSDRLTPYPPSELPLMRASRGESPEPEEFFVRRASQSQGLWLNISARPIKDDKKRTWGAIAILRDVTDRKNSEKALQQKSRLLQLLQTVAAAANEATSAKEALQITLDQVCARTGWAVAHALLLEPAAGELLSTRVWHIEHPHRHDAFRRLSEASRFAASAPSLPARVARDGRAIWSLDTALAEADPRFAAAREAGLRSAHGVPIFAGARIIGVMEFFSDQTEAPDEGLMDALRHIGGQVGQVIERKETEETLRRVQSELEIRVLERTVELSKVNAELRRSNEELEQFAMVASHDLQEPLRKIEGFVRVLDKELPERGERTERIVGSLIGAVTRIQELVRNLLIFARIDRAEAAQRPTDMNQVVAQVKADLDGMIRDAAASVSAGPLPTISANPAQMYQLFQNLVANGIRFRGKSEPQVRIAAERRGEEWLFSVQDNGMGMDKDRAERVFDIFQRRPSAEQPADARIGLAICRKIVEQHGGRISLDSLPGNGSTFRFTLPAH